MSGKRTSEQFYKDVNRLGVTTSIITLISMLAVPLGTAYYYGLGFDISEALGASLSLIAIFLPTAVAENISYYSVLGAGGLYLGSITGNVMNLKLPVAVAGQKIADVEPGSEEGDIISMVSIGVSSIVVIVILFLGAFGIGSWLVPILENPLLKPGFDNITPALLGAITIPQLVQKPKNSILPILIALVCYLMLGSSWGNYSSYVLLANMLVTSLFAYLCRDKD